MLQETPGPVWAQPVSCRHSNLFQEILLIFTIIIIIIIIIDKFLFKLCYQDLLIGSDTLQWAVLLISD